MTKEEAIKIVRENMHLSYDEGNIFEALKTLVPELKESEDERIIKTLQEYVKNRNWPLNGPTQDEVLAWLENKKQSFRQIHDGAIWDSGLRTGIELGKKEQKPDGDDETEVQKAYREGKNAGRKEVFDHPEYYGLQLRRMYDYETGEKIPEWSDEDKAMLNMIEYRLKDWDNIKSRQGYQDNYASKSPIKWLEDLPERFVLQPKQEWSEEDKEWLSEVYFAIDHSMYSEDERQAMKNYINSLRKNRKTKFDPKPGDKFWVRCKSREDSGLWFDKGDERPAYTIDDGRNGIQYIVCLDKDGKGNAVSYQNKESFLEIFEIIEKQ